MIELKRISDEEVIEWMAKNKCNGFIGDYYKQAQLEADQEKVNAREVEWIKALLKEGIMIAEPKDLDGIRKRLELAIVQEIFKEIEDKLGYIKDGKYILGRGLSIKEWQALKQKYLGGCEMTDEDKKKILEWCGIHRHYSTSNVPIWLDNNHNIVSPLKDSLPVQDLNFYFKYAVPKLEQAGYKYEICATTSSTQHRVAIRDRGFSLVGRLCWSDDPAEAFGQALLKLIKAK